MDNDFHSALTEHTQAENGNPNPHTSITEIVPNGFFTVDQNWIVKSWNKAAAKLLRVPANEILGQNLWNTFSGTLPKPFYKAYHAMHLQDVPAQIEEYWPQMHTNFHAFTFYNGDTLSVSFKSDTAIATGYPRQQLKVLNELYRSITEVTNDCLWEWNITAGEIFWIDGSHNRMFGYRIANMLIPQSFWEERLHPGDKVRMFEELHNIINESMNPLWECEYRFRKANGEYAYVHDRAHIVRNAQNVAIRMVGATQDITARRLSEMQLQQERKTRQLEITSAILTAHENERADISRELDENLNQLLAVTKMYIEMGMSGREDKNKYLTESHVLVTKVISEVRKISKAIVVPGTHGLGLADNVANYINDLSTRHPLKIEFYSIRIVEQDLKEKLLVCIYRIIQEQLNNIVQHSRATHAFIRLWKKEDELILTVSDNGMGCAIVDTANGLGIRNIISRAELCDGTIEITSKPNEGFILKVCFQNAYKQAL